MDPKPADRVYYRHVIEGSRGYEVVRDGKTYIRLDRAAEEILRVLNADWIIDHEVRPMTRAQAAQVALAADKQLCVTLGIFPDAKRSWLEMKEERRLDFMHNGPRGRDQIPGLRKALFDAVMGKLLPYTNG